VIFGQYSQDQLDGRTSVMSQGLNVAAANGLHVCQGAGNSGHDTDPQTSTLVPPADAFRAITVGAVDASGVIAIFSSDGPTADGRLKPELLTRGVNVRTVSPADDTAVVGSNGTSFATPLAAGVAACLVQAHPTWTVDQLRTQLFLNADRYVTLGGPDPLSVLGFGIADALASLDEDCNDNATADADDLAGGVSGDCNDNGIPDECDVAALVSPDDRPDGLPDECTECTTGPGCPDEVESLLLAKQFPDVLLTWAAAANVATYSIRRAATPQSTATSEVARVPQWKLTWVEVGGLSAPAAAEFYLVRGVTVGAITGP
jgi:hypothetical protein